MEGLEVGSPAYWRAWQASVHPPPLSEPAQQKLATEAIKQHSKGARLFADLQREQRARLEQAELEVNALLHKSEQHRAATISAAGYCGRFGSSSRGALNVSAVGHYDISSADAVTRKNAPRCVFTCSRRNSTQRQGSAGSAPALAASPVQQRQHIAGAASFSQVDRFTSDNRAAMAGPGPAHYKPQVTALTDKAANFSYGKAFDSSQYATINQNVDEHDWRVFGYGCSADEHVLYGQCLDGKCALRKRNEIQHHAAVLAAQRRQHTVPSTQATGRVTDFTTCYDCSASLDATSLTSNSIVTGTTASTSASVRAAGRQSALHYACLYGDLQQVHSLCQQHGADVAALDERGCTPLHIAAERGHAACVQRLLANVQHPFVTPCKYVTARAAPAVNARDARGRNPLMLACSKGHAAVVELLIRAGADCTLKDHRGKAAYDVLPRSAEELYQIVKCSADLAVVQAQLAAVEGQQRQQQQQQQQHHTLQSSTVQT
jgi:Ankyrin repeats (3 copies)